MIRYYSASKVITLAGEAMENGVVAVNEQGEIVGLYTAEQGALLDNVNFFEGYLVPGFINAHCHLELSHLQGKIPAHTGLVGFIKEIIASRNAFQGNSDEDAEAAILGAMQKADQRMFETGVVAVADISNQLVSKPVKLSSSIFYHTLIEIFGFNREAVPIMEQGLALKREFEPLRCSVVPHAPYSVNRELFSLLSQNFEETGVWSIHNQETAAESELFVSGVGPFQLFLESLGIALREEQGKGKNSLHYHFKYAPKRGNILLVHNTFSSGEDMDLVLASGANVFWALCPNANLYIENTLPDIELMRAKGLKICIGTDSLASNWDLNILSELKSIQKQFSIPLEELLVWACKHGAELLGLDQQLGSLAVGKKPGLVWINNVYADKLSGKSEAIRII